MKEKILKIDGIHCMGCILGLEEELEKIDTIDTVKGNLETKTVVIQYQEEFPMEKVKEKVKKLGFKVVE